MYRNMTAKIQRALQNQRASQVEARAQRQWYVGRHQQGQSVVSGSCQRTCLVGDCHKHFQLCKHLNLRDTLVQRSESPRLWETNEDDSPTNQHLWDTEKK